MNKPAQFPKRLAGVTLALITLIGWMIVTNHSWRWSASRFFANQTNAKKTAITGSLNSVASPNKVDAAAEARIREVYSKLPLSFEANYGQTDAQVKFISRGNGYNLFLTPTEAVLALTKTQNTVASASAGASASLLQGIEGRQSSASNSPSAVLRMTLVGANAHPQMTGAEELSGKTNYFMGKDPKRWRSNVPTYGKVKYRGVYPGVDLIYYGHQRQLEYDFVVAPGADPKAIRLAFNGVQQMRVDAEGNLLLGMAGGEVRQHKPILYQEENGIKQVIDGRYIIHGEREVGFEIAGYDTSRPLMIDPVISYSTYLGGSLGDTGLGIAVDASGIYVTGSTTSLNFPGAGTSAINNGFFKSTNSAGSWSASNSGLTSTNVQAIAIDQMNPSTLYAAVQTNPGVFKSTNGGASWTLSSTGLSGGVSNLVVDPSNSATIYATTSGSGIFKSTNFGASWSAINTGLPASTSFVTLAVDPTNSATLYAGANTGASSGIYKSIDGGANWSAINSGLTTSGKVVLAIVIDPITPSTLYIGTQDYVFKSTDGGSSWVAKNSSSGLASNFIQALAIDPLNPNTLYAGTPVSGASVYKSTNGGNTWTASGLTSLDVRALVVDPVTTSTIYAGTLGGVYKSTDSGANWSLSSSGLAHTTVRTLAIDRTTPATLYAGGLSNSDGFVAKLNPTGSALIYSTYFGGSGNEDSPGGAIATDSSGNVYLTGETLSPDFPVTAGAYQSTSGGVQDTFITKLNSTGAITYSTYLGTISTETGYGIAVDSAGYIYITGSVNGPSPLPTTPNAYRTTSSGLTDAFLMKLNPAGGGAADLLYLTYLGGSGTDRGYGIVVDSLGNAYISGYTASNNFPTTPGAYQPTYGGGASDVFVAKVNTNASGVASLVYATYLGGSGDDSGGSSTSVTANSVGIALDSSGNVYVTGATASTNFPTTASAFQATNGGGIDAFVAKLNPAGGGLADLLYSTFLGGSSNDQGNAIAVDSFGNAYVTGFTNSTNFPTANAFQSASGGGIDAFVAKLNPGASGAASLIYSSYHGGSGTDRGLGIALDASGNAYLTGLTTSTNFPTVNPFQSTLGDGQDAFITKVDNPTTITGTTTTLTSSANPAVYRQTVTLTATVTTVPAGQGTPTGTIQFKNGLGGNFGPPVTLSGGKATINVLLNGPNNPSNFVAVYSGDVGFPASTGTLALPVNKADSTTTLTSSANPSTSGQAVTFTATVGAVAPSTAPSTGMTGTVTFKDGTTVLSTVTLASGAASFTTSALADGTHSITAQYTSDTNYNPSTSATLTQTVGSGTPSPISTSTVLTSSVNPSVTRQLVTFTATVASVPPGQGTPTGTVQFKIVNSNAGPPVTLSGGVATFTTSFSTSILLTGPSLTFNITAVYSGDSNFASSTGTLSQVMNKANSTTTLTSSANPSTYGQPVTFTANVNAVAPSTNPPGGMTGTVTFKDGGATLGTAPLTNGAAAFTTSTLAGGSHSITAEYSSDTAYNPSTSAALTQTVNLFASSTVVTSSVNPAVVRQPIVYTATVTPLVPGGAPSGTVQFKNGTTNIGAPVPLSNGIATISGVATINFGFDTPGTFNITAVYSGDSFYNGSTGTFSQVVNKADSSVTLTSSINPSTYGQPVTFTSTVSAVAPSTAPSGGMTGTVTFKDGGVTLGTATLSNSIASFTTSALGAGSHSITAQYSGDTSYNPNTSPALNQGVNQASTTTAVTSSPNPANSGQVVSLTATVSVIAPGAGTPTGTVQFFDGATALGAPVALSGGVASLTSSFTTEGSHLITAVYSGAVNFVGSQSPSYVQGVPTSAPTQSTTLNYDSGTSVPAQVAQVPVDDTTVQTVLPNPTGGTTTVTVAPINAGSYTVPSAFQVSNLAYEISAPSGSYNTNGGSTPIRLSFTVPDNDGQPWTEAEFNSLAIIHIVNGVPQALVTTHNFSDKQISADTDSLSPFVIARANAITPLTVGSLNANPTAPIQVGGTIAVSGTVTGTGNASATWFWGDGSKTDVAPFNLTGTALSLSASHTYTATGVYTVRLKVIGPGSAIYESLYRYVVVYDPNGGFVTGGGWINSPPGAYAPNPSLTGKANFGFEAKYKNGAAVPSGQTEFQFHAAGLNFKSTSYEWLVVGGPKAQFKGEGTINGQGNYGFLLTATDGQVSGGGGVDKFRIKIWDKATGQVVYDNQMGAADDADATTAIAGGSIVIHK